MDDTTAPEIPADDDAPEGDARWTFLRDVAVFQGKMVLDNLRDIALMPASLIAAGLDLFFKRDGEREGRRFYEVLKWGRRSEELINVYGAICKNPRDVSGDDPEWADSSIRRNYSVDAVVDRLQAAVQREYEKGGPTANVKNAVDRAIDEMRAQADKNGGSARDAMDRMAERMARRAEESAKRGGDAYQWTEDDPDARGKTG